jgi:hypothetical protein
MDLEAIWQSHKPFIIKVAGGAAVLLLLLGGRGSLADSAAKLAKGNASRELSFQDKRAALEGAEGREKGRAESLETDLEPAVLKSLMWEPSPKLVLPAGEGDPVLWYATALREATSDLQRRVERVNAKFPFRPADLGLQEGLEAPMVVEALAKVDLVRGVLVRLLEVGVMELVSVDPGDARYEPRQGDGRHLRTLPLRVVFQGDARLLADVLARFQVKGSFLQVTGCQVRRQGKQPGAGVVGELDLQALSGVDALPQGRASKAPSGGARRASGGPPRSFGRER